MLTILCTTLLPNFHPLTCSIKTIYFLSRVESSVDSDPSDLDLQCFQKWTNPGSAGQRLKLLKKAGFKAYQVLT